MFTIRFITLRSFFYAKNYNIIYFAFDLTNVYDRCKGTIAQGKSTYPQLKII